MSAISVHVKLFATLKDEAKTQFVTLHLTQANPTIEDVRTALVEQFPPLETRLPSALAAVNQEYVFPGHAIHDGDEIAFFPPVSGGSGYPEVFLVADSPIDLNTLTAQIVIPATGAVALFSGYVRGETTLDGQRLETEALEYEAYTPMALAKMKQVAAELRTRWPQVQGIAIVQRVGKLHIGEPTVLIACAAAHRDHGCFEAARYGIDRLKEIVPVWKKEIGRDGSTWVEGHYQPTPEDTAS